MSNDSRPNLSVQAPVRKFRVMSTADLNSIPEESTTWLVDGLLPKIGTSLCGAPPKACKSTVARQLCCSVAQGMPFFGRPVQPGRALYWSTQERAIEIKKHFDKLGCSNDPRLFTIADQQFNPAEAVELLDQAITETPGLDLVVIDMLIDAVKIHDEGKYADAARVFSTIRPLAEKHRLHILATHHTKKVVADNPVHSYIGSTAITGSFDQLLTFSVDAQQNRYLVTTQRYGTSIPCTQLTFDAERQALDVGRSIAEIKEEQHDALEKRIMKDILLSVLSNPGSTKDQILKVVRGDISLKKSLFKVLRDEGQLVEHGGGLKGDPFTYQVSTLHQETDAELTSFALTGDRR